MTPWLAGATKGPGISSESVPASAGAGLGRTRRVARPGRVRLGPKRRGDAVERLVRRVYLHNAGCQKSSFVFLNHQRLDD